jgi:hypothetical protein
MRSKSVKIMMLAMYEHFVFVIFEKYTFMFIQKLPFIWPLFPVDIMQISETHGKFGTFLR